MLCFFKKEALFLNASLDKDAEMLVHAFVISWLDYCSALFARLPHSKLRRLQLEASIQLKWFFEHKIYFVLSLPFLHLQILKSLLVSYLPWSVTLS